MAKRGGYRPLIPNLGAVSSNLAGDVTSLSGDMLSAKPSPGAHTRTAFARPPTHAAATAGRYRPQRSAYTALPA